MDKGEASHDAIHPELTNCSVSVEHTFGTPLGDKVKISFLGGRCSTFYINSKRKKSYKELGYYISC